MSKTDSEATAVKKTKKQRTNAGIRMDQEMGKRWCMKCDKLIPLDLFRPNKRQYMCILHLREIQNYDTSSNNEKRAFNSIRCRAYADMVLFKQARMFLPRTLFTTMLTDEQMTNYSAYCIIPKRPDQPLSKDNSIVVTSIQRIYVVAKWKTTRDPDQYEHDLNHILSTSTPTKSQ